MCWNLDEEKISRAAAFITDSSRDRRYDETPASVGCLYRPSFKDKQIGQEGVLTEDSHSESVFTQAAEVHV